MDRGDGLVLVTGATGNTGRALIEALTGRGVPVRAMVRREADRDGLPAGAIDVRDIAMVAAVTLTEPGHEARRTR